MGHNPNIPIKPRPIAVVVRLRSASERFVVAAFFIIWVSSESLLKSFPVLVTSKNAISCGGTRHVWRLDNKNTNIWKTKTKLSLSGNPKTALGNVIKKVTPHRPSYYSIL